MCDFHSVIVDRQGKVYHLPSNSHSEIASANGLKNTLEVRQFWECEWKGIGDVPTTFCQLRSYGTSAQENVPDVAEQAAQRHYAKLVKILAGELDPMETAPFNLPEYSDVRDRVEQLERERTAQARQDAVWDLLAPHVDAFDDLDTDDAIAVIRQLCEETGAEIVDLAAGEIEEAIENDESRYDAGYDAGYDTAAEELYSYDYMQEEIESAKDELRKEMEDEFAERLETLKEEWRAEYDAECRGASMFPDPPANFGDDARAWARITTRIAGSVAKDNGRYAFGGIHVCRADIANVYLTATCGRQLAVVKAPGATDKPRLLAATPCKLGATVKQFDTETVSDKHAPTISPVGRFPNVPQVLPEFGDATVLGIDAGILKQLADSIDADSCVKLLIGDLDKAIGVVGGQGFGVIMPRTVDSATQVIAEYTAQRDAYVAAFQPIANND